MIKNVIFDIGNTLIAFKPIDYLNQVFNYNKELVDMLYQTIFRSEEWIELDRGTITQDEAVSRLCSRSPEIKEQIVYIMENWHDMHIPMYDSVKLIKYLKNSGYGIYLLSNYHEKAFDYIYNKFDFIREVDGRIISSHVKLLKPEKEIYEALLKKYDLKPEECAFIDDFEGNITSANKLGIHGICFKDAASVYEFINKLNTEQAC